MLINMMEHYVDERLSELLSKSTVNGEIFTRITQEMESQPTVDLDVAVIQAITHVGSNPRHKK